MGELWSVKLENNMYFTGADMPLTKQVKKVKFILGILLLPLIASEPLSCFTAPLPEGAPSWYAKKKGN
jgi:hypothetical protein